MRIAYCEETKSIISAQDLRRFVLKNELKNYSVFCPDCKLPLTGANITGIRTIKVFPYFKRFPHTEHAEACKYKSEEKELKLGVSKLVIKKDFERTENEGGDDSKKDEINEKDGKERNYTYYIDDIVDTYLTGFNGDLTISLQGKFIKRPYQKWFKRVRFFKDGREFIYYGLCRIGLYEGKYAVWFKDYVVENGETIKLSAFIDKETLGKYKYRKDFISNIEDVINTGKDIVCYFVYLTEPALKTFNGKNGKFKKYDFRIDKLSLITFRHLDDG
ncbi:MAG: hypothetical protein ACYCSB_00930 [bacterium]|jgi:hypothetical protein